MKAWFDPRAIVLAALLAVAAALPLMTTSVVRRDYYLFNVTLTSTSPGNTQLFWDLGRGYSENDSSRQPLKIEPRPVVYRYMIPMGDIKALRLDPIDGIGTFTYSHAEIVNHRNEVVHSFRPEDFRAANEISRLEVHGDTLTVVTTPGSRDPVLELDFPRPLRLRSDLHIWLRLGLPVAVPVFLLGLLIGTPAIASRLQRAVAAAGRWCQGRPRTALALTVTAAIAVQCHPVIFLGRSFATPNNGTYMLYSQLPTLPAAAEDAYANSMGSDVGALLFNHLYYPMVEHEALCHGELPLWNRYSLGGMPLLGQGQSMFGEPLNFIPLLANGAAWAWDVRFVLARWLFVAGLAFTVWRLTRHLGASLLVAGTAVFISYFTFRINHPANFSVCYAPLILWAWTGLIQAPTLRRQVGWLAGLILANWMVMSSGTVKEAYMAMVCLNLAGVILLAQLPSLHRGRTLVAAVVAGVIFILLTAPAWLSFLVALGHSWTVYDQPGVIPVPLAQLIGFFDDIFYRQTNADEAVVLPGLNFFFLLGVLWWLVNPRLWRTDRAGRALALGGLFPFAMAFGIIPAALIMRTPFLGNIYHIGNTFSCPLLVIAIVLAGCGFRDAAEQAQAGGWSRPLALVFALTAGLLAAYFISTRDNGFATSAFFAGYVPALLAAFIALPCGLLWAMRSGRPGPLYVALALGLPLLLWRHCQYAGSFFNQYAFVPGLRCDLHAPSPGVGFVDQQAKEPGRRVGWGNSLFPAYNIALGWEGTYGVDTLRSGYYHDIALEWDMKRVWVWEWANKPADAPRLVPIHDLLNVDYYVADHAEPAVQFAGLQLLGQSDLDVYRSPTAWPRAFFCDRVVGYGTIKDFARLVASGDGRPFAAVQEPGDPVSLPPTVRISADNAAGKPPGASWAGRTVRAASGYRLTPNTTTFTVDTPGPGVVVLTETYYPEDFRVTVDGKPSSYFRVNHAFKGVSIESAGRHEITFAYWPLHTTLSLGLATAGAILALVAGGAVYLRTGSAS